MLEQHTFLSCPETRFASRYSKRSVCVQHMPRNNSILAGLPREDYVRLLPDLEGISLPLGCTIYRTGNEDNYLYFLTAGIVSRFHIMANGASAELSVTGNEGVIGVASFLGGESTPSQAMVLSAGYAYRLRVDLLKNKFEHDFSLQQLLLRYALALIVQTGQIAVCNLHHTLEQRLNRWILSCLDRLSSNELMMTHELIASMLGVRRETVTQATQNLEKAGLIHNSRGHIIVLDQPRLEAQACECYTVFKREYDRLHPENRKSGTGPGFVESKSSFRPNGARQLLAS